MTAYRLPVDSTAEMHEDCAFEPAGEQPAEAPAFDATGLDETALEAASFDEAAFDAAGFDETAFDAAGFEASPFDEDLPDIPEVPFSVRVASMWGTVPAMPPATAPATGDDRHGDDGGAAGTDDARFLVESDAARSAGAAADALATEKNGPVVLDEAQAWQRLLRLLERHPGRVVLGISGAPGAGKTSYADYLAACCVDAAVIGVDGFQLSSAALTRMGRGARRGAPDTFDLDGYLALLRRLRRDDQRTVWAPEYWRDLEEPVAGAVAVRPSTRVVITEGNYLLLPQRQWLEARALCHEVWYVEVPERVRVERLVGRHRHYGRSKAQARARVTVGVDAENAHVVAATRDRADVVVQLSLSAGEHY